MVTQSSMKKLINLETGLFSRRIYTDPDIYQQELEQIWGRCWIGVGHESLISKPNDFFAAYIAEDPILVTRDSKGKIHAFLNMCRHRGNRICRADFGNAPSFMCTYHGWTFSTDGKLVGVPGYKEAYFEELDRSQWGLVEARADAYKGLLFATWDKTTPSLLDYLGDAAWYLDVQLDRRAGGTTVLGGVQRHVMTCNWKIATDNTAGDNYHVPVTHGSLGFIGAPGGRGGIPTALRMAQDSVLVYAGNGHCINGKYIGPARDVTEGTSGGSIVTEYYKTHAAEFRNRVGEIRGNQTIGLGEIFPATAYHGIAALRLRIPRGPLKTEEWTYCLVDKDAPQEVKDAQKRALTFRFGVSGVMESDDSNNWDQVTRSGLLPRGKKEVINYQMGIGRDKKSEILPGVLSSNIGEGNQRGFYGFWAEMMDAPSWPEVQLSPRTLA